jgi:hypothetical protein
MTLLVISILDGNNEILPIAWAMVLIEDMENWTWFLDHIKQSFKDINCEDMVLINDKDKEL